MKKWWEKNISRNSSIERFHKIARELQKNHIASTSNGTALFELYISVPDYIITLLFVSWARLQNYSLVAYAPLRNKSAFENFKFFLFSIFRIDNGVLRPFRVFRGMGINNFLIPSLGSTNKTAAHQEYLRVRNFNKYQLLNYELFGIRIGDIFYDDHLRQRSLVTIDFGSIEFKQDFEFFVSNFIWWHTYFKESNIQLVCVSHSVYRQAITARLGLHFKAKVFVSSASRIYRLTRDNPWADMEFLDYDPNSTEQLGYTINPARAAEGLLKLKQGKSITAAHYSVSGYLGGLNTSIVSKTSRPKVMIAAHCFSDAPHVYGDMLFEDFDSWLNFLHELSLKTNYDWYIKAHPAFYETDKEHFQKYTRKFINFTAISPEYSNTELIAQGIDVVLTVYGTIAFEAAEQGVLVINASKRTPHGNYSFTISPTSIPDYEKSILQIPILKESHTISTSEILHFFDLHHLRTAQTLIFHFDVIEYLNFVGGYQNQFTNPRVLDYWMNRYYSPEMIATQVEELGLYINSGKRSLRDFKISPIRP